MYAEKILGKKKKQYKKQNKGDEEWVKYHISLKFWM